MIIKRPFPPTPARGEPVRPAPAAGQPCRQPAGHRPAPLVERILSLKETCRLQARATYAVLVDAITSFFQGQQPDLSWINEELSTSPHPLSVRMRPARESNRRSFS